MTDVTSVASAHTLLSFRLTFSRHQLIGWVAFLNDAKLHTICPWRYVGICLTRIIKAFSWVSTSGKWIHVKITLHKLSGQFKVIAVRSHPTGQMRMRLWRPEIGLPDGSAGRESACNAGDPSWIPGLGSSPREGTGYPLQYSWASLGAQMVKNPPAMPETWVRSLGWEDPLEEGMAAHSVFLPGESHGHRSLVGYSPFGHKKLDTTERLSTHRPETEGLSQAEVTRTTLFICGDSCGSQRKWLPTWKKYVWELELLLECSEVWKTL